MPLRSRCEELRLRRGSERWREGVRDVDGGRGSECVGVFKDLIYRSRQKWLGRLRTQSSTNTLSALERFDVRVRSTVPISAATGIFSWSAISFSPDQNAGSSETLVRWPEMDTERFCTLWPETLWPLGFLFDGQVLGPVIASGRTHASNSSPLTSSRASAASRRAMPSAWAFLAALAALS